VERRSFLKNAGVGLAAGSVAMPAIAQNAPTIKWRLASSFPKSLDTIYGGAEVMAKRVPKPPAASSRSRSLPAGKSFPDRRSSTPSRTVRSKWGIPVSYYFFGKDPTYALETREFPSA
jgi:TRAP-type mannitol/chloroaromatic compound transport system substrate-binding protein